MRLVTLLGGFLVAVAAVPAHADGVFTPYVGSNFGGKTEKNSVVFGAALGGISGSGLGFEFDVGYSPEFFRIGDESDGNVTTVMGNLMFAAPPSGAGIRPYVSGGFGLIRFSLADVGDLFDISRNDFGVNAGAGLMLFASDSFGIRGDVRYFRSLKDDDEEFPGFDLGNFDFWRGSVGATFKW